jgi:hypothetical protein
MPMPMKTWEPPPHQHDPDRQPPADSRAEPRNFDAQPVEGAADPDGGVYERPDGEYEDINTHGSER